MRNHSKLLPAVALAVALLPVAALARGVWLADPAAASPQALVSALNAEPIGIFSSTGLSASGAPAAMGQTVGQPYSDIVGGIRSGASTSYGG